MGGGDKYPILTLLLSSDLLLMSFNRRSGGKEVYRCRPYLEVSLLGAENGVEESGE